jgi:hypothetical protein
MKKIFSNTLVLMALFLPFCLNAQTFPTDPETKKITYQETVIIDSVSKSDLYERSVNFMTELFKTNKFDVNDKVNYKVTNEGYFSISYTYDFKYKSENIVTYNLTINQKDGKYRYTFDNFMIYDIKTGPKTSQALEAYYQKMKTESKKDFLNKVNDEVNKIIEDMKKHLATGVAEDKDDW